jgi:hypothetical protein
MTGMNARSASSPAFDLSPRCAPLWRRYGAAVAVALVGAAIAVHALAPRGLPGVKPPFATAAAMPSFLEADLPPLIGFASENLEKSARHSYLAGVEGERRDVMTLGDVASEGAFVRLVATTNAATGTDLSLFVIVATQAAAIDSSILRMDAPRTWSGERGRVEWAPMRLLTPSQSRDCLALRALDAKAAELSGIVCPNAAGAADESMLACIVGELAATARGIAEGLPDMVDNRRSSAPPCRGFAG